MRVRLEHIREEWDEGHPDRGGEGYWIVLRPGWCWAGDPVGVVHCIHEATKTEAHRESVRTCECVDCRKSLA